jgi:3-hydroxyacyl-[acyl-carrier-protein] dehydratase
MFDIREIMKNVPHWFPFLLIDRVTEFVPNESVTVLKNVSINEAQFQGHFPAAPVLPGVMIIENMAQAACFLLSKSSGGMEENVVYYLGKVNKAAFKKPVVPGDQLVTKITVDKIFGDTMAVTGRAFVDGNLVAKSELLFGKQRTGMAQE